MSLILSGPKRIYVLLLFWQRLAEPCAACPRWLAGKGNERIECGPCCRILLMARFHRIFLRHLVGLSLFIVDPQPFLPEDPKPN